MIEVGCLKVEVEDTYCLHLSSPVSHEGYMKVTEKLPKHDSIFRCVAGSWRMCCLFENHSGKTGKLKYHLVEYWYTYCLLFTLLCGLILFKNLVCICNKAKLWLVITAFSIHDFIKNLFICLEWLVFNLTFCTYQVWWKIMFLVSCKKDLKKKK